MKDIRDILFESKHKVTFFYDNGKLDAICISEFVGEDLILRKTYKESDISEILFNYYLAAKTAQPPVNNKLEPLDENELFEEISEELFRIRKTSSSGIEGRDKFNWMLLPSERRLLAKHLCSKFGHKPIKYPDKINLNLLMKEPKIKIAEVLAWNKAIDEFRRINNDQE